MSVRPLELEVLGWLLNDYESPSSLASDIGRELGRVVSEVEIAEALEGLSARGLAQAFRFDGAFWVAVGPGTSQTADIWYLATAHGRSVADAI
jgi:hypothetical protein